MSNPKEFEDMLATVKQSPGWAADHLLACISEIASLRTQLAESEAVTVKDVDRMEGALTLIKSLESQLASAKVEGQRIWNAARALKLYWGCDAEGAKVQKEYVLQNKDKLKFETYADFLANQEKEK